MQTTSREGESMKEEKKPVRGATKEKKRNNARGMERQYGCLGGGSASHGSGRGRKKRDLRFSFMVGVTL